MQFRNRVLPRPLLAFILSLALVGAALGQTAPDTIATIPSKQVEFEESSDFQIESLGVGTPNVTLEMLPRLDPNRNSAAFALLERYIGKATNNPEQKRKVAERLAAILSQPEATIGAKRFACEYLILVGSEAQVPALAALLDDPQTVEMARRALEAIPGETADKALRDAMGRLKGRALIGVIHSLGARHDHQALDALEKLARFSKDPELAIAAAHAMSQIHTGAAALAMDRAYSTRFLDAGARRNEYRAAKGDRAIAGLWYTQSWGREKLPQNRLVGLTGMVSILKEDALNMLLKAFADNDSVVRAQAIRLSLKIPGTKTTSILVDQVSKLHPYDQVLLIEALAERADPAARDAIAAWINNENDTVAIAAIEAMTRLGDASMLNQLATIAAAQESGPLKNAARATLARMVDPDTNTALIALLKEAKPEIRAEMVRALGARGAEEATDALLKAASDNDRRVRMAAWEALAETASPKAYPKLVALLTSLDLSDAESKAVQKTVLAVGRRLDTPTERLEPILEALKETSMSNRVTLLRVAASLGGDDALSAVRKHADSADRAVRDVAVRALTAWPDEAAASDLLKIAKDSSSQTYRVLALRGYMRLAQSAKETRLAMLQKAAGIASTPDEKKQLLTALSKVADRSALDIALPLLDNPAVRSEARIAVLQISDKIARQEPEAVQAAMKRVQEVTKDDKISKQVERIIEKSNRLVDCLEPRPYDSAPSEARKKDIASKLPQGARLVGYADCGVDSGFKSTQGIVLKQTNGKAWNWPGAAATASPTFGTIAFDARKLAFNITGLKPGKPYSLGFTWWDYDGNGRAQSLVVMSQRGGVNVMGASLPSHSGAAPRGPALFRLPIPPEMISGGVVRIEFRADRQSNVVASEIWLLESDKPLPALKDYTAPKKPVSAKKTAPAKKTNSPKKILIITGQDYPGHKWKLTSPVVKEILEEEPMTEVRVVDDPAFLDSQAIHAYDAIVLHFMNWEQPAPGAQARENLLKFVKGGKGLVLLHFACGAFSDWPEFVELVGRVYDPKLRGHDPKQPFMVKIVDKNHPITKGMKDFETDDELYTCLAGDTAMHVVAEATSKVDKKVYPMGFVLDYGKGRVFHTVLGHDVKAFSSPGARELIRRGTAWAATR